MSLTAFSVPSDDCSLNLGDIDDLERLLGKGVSGAAARRKCETEAQATKTRRRSVEIVVVGCVAWLQGLKHLIYSPSSRVRGGPPLADPWPIGIEDPCHWVGRKVGFSPDMSKVKAPQFLKVQC